jgi:putative multiple sugar transport system permease protein
MGVLNLGLANMSVDSNFVQIIKGLVLLGAVAFDVYSKAQGRRSFIGAMLGALQRGVGAKGSASRGTEAFVPPADVADEALEPDGFRTAARIPGGSVDEPATHR